MPETAMDDATNVSWAVRVMRGDSGDVEVWGPYSKPEAHRTADEIMRRHSGYHRATVYELERWTPDSYRED